MNLPFSKKKTNDSLPKGRFIVIDGTDGSGKSTQMDLLLETLKISDYEVAVTDFPQYGSKSAGLVEEYLNGTYGDVNPYASSIFYAADRFDAGFKIRQWLLEGKIVVSNRYVTANAGNQGARIDDEAERVKFFKWLDHLEYTIFNIPKPDLNIILHMPAATAYKLVKQKNALEERLNTGKKTRLAGMDLEYLKKSEQSYLDIARLFPNTKLVECVQEDLLLSPQQVHNKVWELVRRIALKGREPNLTEK